MEILYFNVWWMIWNSFLAIIPVGLAYVYFQTSRPFYKFLLAMTWFLFLPNTLYVFSDLEHLITQWGQLDMLGRIFLLVQYANLEVIGLTAYIFSLYAFEKELRRIFKKGKRRLVLQSIVGLNFLIGFAIVIGKVERVNSWDIFTATDSVFGAFANVLRSDGLVLLFILFGLFGNFFYFLFRDPVVKYARKILKS